MLILTGHCIIIYIFKINYNKLQIFNKKYKIYFNYFFFIILNKLYL